VRVYDAGALIGLDRDDRDTWEDLHHLLQVLGVRRPIRRV
jgi:hypothetical protein